MSIIQTRVCHHTADVQCENCFHLHSKPFPRPQISRPFQELKPPSEAEQQLRRIQQGALGQLQVQKPTAELLPNGFVRMNGQTWEWLAEVKRWALVLPEAA